MRAASTHLALPGPSQTDFSALENRVDPGDSPADSIIARDASGTPHSVTSPYVYAEARGVVMNDATKAAQNATILQAILTAGKVAVLPPGTCSYDTPLKPTSGSGIVGAGRTLTTLSYTGNGNGVQGHYADGTTGIYRTLLAGFTLTFAGTGSGHGISIDALRYAMFRDVSVKLFPGSGHYMWGTTTNQGTWSNRYIDCEFTQNGRMGIEAVGIGHNAHFFYGTHTSLNGLDGVYAEKAQKWYWGIQSEANARHAFYLRGCVAEDLSPAYVEHQDPGTFDVSLQPPNYARQSPRYIIRLDSAPDGTRNGKIACRAAMLSGAHNGTTIITDAILYADNTNDLSFVHNRTSGAVVETIINDTVSRHEAHDNASTDLATLSNIPGYLNMQYRNASGAFARRSRGLLSNAEGVENSVVNGGFDIWTTAPGDPDGWTGTGGLTTTQETGTDGGYRCVINGWRSLAQTITGPIVGGMARRGMGVLVFDAIVPTANTYLQAMVNITCKNGGGTNVGGGYTSGANGLPKSDTEKPYELQFYVPATTVQIEVKFWANRAGATNVDSLKIDRVAVYPGEVPKDYAPKMLPAPVTPLAYTTSNITTSRTLNASTATTADVANALGTLLADLKAAGIVG